MLTSESVLQVFEGITLTGQTNTDSDVILSNVKSSIRRGHPQVHPVPLHNDRAVIVAGGPSINETLDELRELYFEGAKIVTVNGAYHWCLERNIRPSAQVVIDARAHNARFVSPDVPRCRYYLASQCAPVLWDAVASREFVGIYHDAGEDAVKAELDEYYLKQWSNLAGGTTVGTRAIGLLRTLGFYRMDLFGFDSCWLDGQHHAYAQPENDKDGRYRVVISPVDNVNETRTFQCAPWHLKQAEDFLRFIRLSGHQFVLRVHGRGMLAYLMQSASTSISVDKQE
jgi:hypothetical protein